jgi:hypothetical protein
MWELPAAPVGMNWVRYVRTAMIDNPRISFWNFAILAAATLMGLAWLATPSSTRAQAPPGPLPQVQSQDAPPPALRPQAQKPAVQPRTSIFGDWKLDRDESDDPRKKMQEARSQTQNNGGYGGNRRMGGGYPGGGYPGGGYPGGGGGGGGPYGGRRGGQQNESDDERQRMEEVINPSNALTVAEAQRNVEVDLFDDAQHKRALFTDGRKVQKSKDVNYQEIPAHWDDKRLVTDEKSPRGGKMSRIYELSSDGTQLYETLRMTTGRNNTSVVIRYVYDQSGALPAAAANTAPASTPAAAPKQ